MGIGQPCVQRHDGALDPKPNQETGHACANPEVVCVRACGGDEGQVTGSTVHERDPHKHDRRADAADDQVLEAGLDSGVCMPPKGDQGVGADAHELAKHVQVEQIACHDHAHQPGDQQQEQRIVGFVPAIQCQVAARIDGHDEAQAHGDARDDDGTGIGCQKRATLAGMPPHRQCAFTTRDRRKGQYCR